jgi:O-methyltransferase
MNRVGTKRNAQRPSELPLSGELAQGERLSISSNGDIAFLPGEMTPYDLQEEVESAVDRVRYHTMVTFSRLATTYQIASYCDDAGVPGAFVECGVWKGGVSGLMAIANLRHGRERRTLHLFDSFQDMCEPDEDVDGDRAIREARDWAGRTDPLKGALVAMDGFYSQMGGPGTVAECHALLTDDIGFPDDHVRIHEGWFQDTVPTVIAELDEIAILRLDSDFYASTRFCLEQLFDRVVPGGFVVIDDYGCYEGCRKAVDEFLATRTVRYFLHHADAECRYLQKPYPQPGKTPASTQTRRWPWSRR